MLGIITTVETGTGMDKDVVAHWEYQTLDFGVLPDLPSMSVVLPFFLVVHPFVVQTTALSSVYVVLPSVAVTVLQLYSRVAEFYSRQLLLFCSIPLLAVLFSYF